MKWIFVTLALLFSQPIFADQSQPLPVEAYASIPDVSHVKLSPSGQYVAAVVRVNDGKFKGSMVSIFDIDSDGQTFPIQTDNEKFTILGLSWANDDTLLVTANYPAIRYGTPTTEMRLFKYSLKDKKTSSVLSRSLLKRLEWVPQIQSDIIDMLDEDDDHILLQLTGFGNAVQYETVMKININKGRSIPVQHARMHVHDWQTDRQGKVRIGIARDDTTYTIYEQSDAGEKRRVLWTFEAFEENQVWPIGFDQDPNILFVRAYHNGYNAIFKVNLTDPTLTKELVFHNENTDVEGDLIYSTLKKKVIGISEGDDSEYTFWDDEYVRLLKGLNHVLPDSDNYITQFSRNERRYIVYSTSSTESGTYFFGDRDNKVLEPIAYRYKYLRPEVLAETKHATYKARDGLEIQAFVTTPLNVEPKNLPTIIFPHGGPISYDNTSFDYWTQFFASRGYAVVKMNFRGSAGYGFDFMQAGLQSWGLEMQNDVIDATKWITEEGVADPKRICIVGASYGGYAALMGVATTKGLYQCAISIAGVTDVENLVKSYRRFRNSDIVKKQIGDDYDALYERSPVSKAQQIDVPVLLIHGDKDRVVSVDHSEDMYNKLKGLDKKVEFIELENGNHQLSNNEHRLTTFRAMERFLAENLAPK